MTTRRVGAADDELTFYYERKCRPCPLACQSSQESVTTADPSSPVRVALREKLKMRFCDAYPPTEARTPQEDKDKENNEYDRLPTPKT